MTADRYDRAAATRIIADLAGPGVFPSTPPVTSATIPYRAHRLVLEPGSHLTLSQRLYLQRFMQPCLPDQVSSATHRMTWTDRDGVPEAFAYAIARSGLFAAVAGQWYCRPRPSAAG